jgi:hypothetical protein
MNRSLVIPAVCSLFAFAGLLAALHRASGWESAARLSAPSAPIKSAGITPVNADLISIAEAEQLLASLAGEYIRPWQQWASSPRRLYSRVAPSPVPTILTKVEVSTAATSASDGFLVATIAISKGPDIESIPCVVNRGTRQVRLFAEGQWLTEAAWLEKSPLP